jgi:hypothetical protein
MVAILIHQLNSVIVQMFIVRNFTAPHPRKYKQYIALHVTAQFEFKISVFKAHNQLKKK